MTAHNATMLYKFKSKETSDLIMLAQHARQILTAIGKEPSAQGILLPDDMSQAIERLQEAVHADEAAAKKGKENSDQKSHCKDDAQDVTKFDEVLPSISLKQRAAPFIEMLKRAQAAQVEVVWGV
jgi:cyclopropane-fatty-acyl-phospholipid synthase